MPKSKNEQIADEWLEIAKILGFMDQHLPITRYLTVTDNEFLQFNISVAARHKILFGLKTLCYRKSEEFKKRPPEDEPEFWLQHLSKSDELGDWINA